MAVSWVVREPTWCDACDTMRLGRRTRVFGIGDDQAHSDAVLAICEDCQPIGGLFAAAFGGAE